MRLAEMEIIAPYYWEHGVEVKDDWGYTVCYYLWDKGIQVPERW